LSDQTITTRRYMFAKFLWWLHETGIDQCGADEIKRFLMYVSTGHTDPNGRWGDPHLTRAVRPRTVKDYHTTLRTFFRWLAAEGLIEESPMEGLKPPVAHSDQIQPFSQEQIATMLYAAKHSRNPFRDEAIILFLLDTGVRASELCGLRLQDIDLVGKRAIVLGKGNKRRTVFMSRATVKVLNRLTRDRDTSPTDPLFMSERDGPLTRSGLQQLMRRIGHTAGVETVRCSPHTFRHTCAIWFLRNGGQLYALKEMLGHTNLQMTMRYVAVAQADVQDQHRQYGAVLRLGASR